MERVYTIPLRNVKDIKRTIRAPRAIREIKIFLTKHMKASDVKIDESVNHVIWARGIQKIPSKITVKAVKDDDGVVTAVFSNGETRPIAIIPLALFVNPNGMEALNNNVWIATTESGNPLLTKATTGGAGEIVSSSLESSTVDLATEFSNMIIVQRAYSAAGKIMTTADEMLQELTNLV